MIITGGKKHKLRYLKIEYGCSKKEVARSIYLCLRATEKLGIVIAVKDIVGSNQNEIEQLQASLAFFDIPTKILYRDFDTQLFDKISEVKYGEF